VSNRITEKWTETTAEAFGDNINTQTGLKAEKIIYEYLLGIYQSVRWYESDRKKQIAGIDFEFKKDTWSNYYTADVKGNLKNTYFRVYPEEIRKKKNHRMIHVDVDSGYAVEYDRVSMLNYIDSLKSDKEYFVFNTLDKSLKHKIAYFRKFRARKTKP
jgi:hypothetical protein